MDKEEKEIRFNKKERQIRLAVLNKRRKELEDALNKVIEEMMILIIEDEIEKWFGGKIKDA